MNLLAWLKSLLGIPPIAAASKPGPPRSWSQPGPAARIDEPAEAMLAEPEAEGGDSMPVAHDRRIKPRVCAREGTRALIIDDSPTIVAMLRKLLKQNGYQTLEAGSAEEGLEIARTLDPELIFLDIVLPGMDGFAALRQLRRDPVTRAIPVIMISGNEQAVEQFYVQRIGADDFMKKPFSREEVFARIEPMLDSEQRPRRRLAATT